MSFITIFSILWIVGCPVNYLMTELVFAPEDKIPWNKEFPTIARILYFMPVINGFFLIFNLIKVMGHSSAWLINK